MTDIDAIRERDRAWFEGEGPVSEDEGRIACHDRRDLLARVDELEASARRVVQAAYPESET